MKRHVTSEVWLSGWAAGGPAGGLRGVEAELGVLIVCKTHSQQRFNKERA